MSVTYRHSPALVGRGLFALAISAFGVLQFLYGDFVPGRAPAWPLDVPGGLIAAYATGACFVIVGAAIAAGRLPREASIIVVVLIFGWAVIRNLPLALADSTFGSPWTRLGKGVALCGGVLAISATASGQLAGRFALGAFLIASGVQHFLFVDAVKTMVPVWIPGAGAWTYVAGAALLAGGTGLIVPATTRAAGIAVGLMLFTWVWILHIPRALAAASPAADRNEWTAVFEAVAFAGLALLLADDRAQRLID